MLQRKANFSLATKLKALADAGKEGKVFGKVKEIISKKKKK